VCRKRNFIVAIQRETNPSYACTPMIVSRQFQKKSPAQLQGRKFLPTFADTNHTKMADMKTFKHVEKRSQPEGTEDFPIWKNNYKYIGVGVIILVIGFLLMTGGKSTDPNVFNPEIFSFRRITLAPIVVVGGFVFILWAIMRKP
jgi:hypothetical protein